MENSKKGTSLIVVFIVCTVISLLLSTTFLVVGNYNLSVMTRKYNLYENVRTQEAVVTGGE